MGQILGEPRVVVQARRGRQRFGGLKPIALGIENRFLEQGEPRSELKSRIGVEVVFGPWVNQGLRDDRTGIDAGVEVVNGDTCELRPSLRPTPNIPHGRRDTPG